MPNKMTDNEIIENIKWCMNPNNACADCPYYELRSSLDCVTSLFGDVLDLINRQKAEIERLEKEGEELQYKLECLLCHSTDGKMSKSTYPLRTMEICVNDTIQEYCEEAQAETIKEFAERFELYIPNIDGETTMECVKNAIKQTLKEMVGENNEN